VKFHGIGFAGQCQADVSSLFSELLLVVVPAVSAGKTVGASLC
jgi:hypothetical protein